MLSELAPLQHGGGDCVVPGQEEETARLEKEEKAKAADPVRQCRLTSA